MAKTSLGSRGISNLSWRIARFLESQASKIDIKLIIASSLALRLFAISFPKDGKVFDEAYYVPAALDFLRVKSSNIEHPFLGKAWVALGTMSFGDNWFGWRIVSVVMGVASLYVFYRLSLRFLPKAFATYGTVLLSFETMFFAHSSLALLEVPSIFFALLTFHLYFSRRYYWSAVSVGLSVLSKETGVLFVLAIVFYHLATSRHIVISTRNIVKPTLFLIVVASTILVPMTAYDVVYKPEATSVKIQATVIEYKDPDGVVTSRTTTTSTFNEATPIRNAVEHIYYIISYASSLTTTNQQDINPGNYAWNWILPIPNAYPPMTYYSIAVNKTITEKTDSIVTTRSIITHPITWYGVGNMPIWWSIWLIIPISIYMISKNRGSSIEPFLLAWIGANYLPMLYLSLVVQRIVYPFYFLNTVPALALGVPYLASLAIAERRLLIFSLFAYAIIVVLFFANYYPVRIFEQ